jgi:hypothetical protein
VRLGTAPALHLSRCRLLRPPIRDLTRSPATLLDLPPVTHDPTLSGRYISSFTMVPFCRLVPRAPHSSPSSPSTVQPT